MKVPYTYPLFEVISIHHCSVFGVGGCKNVIVCTCTSVSMCVLSRSLKTLFGTPEGEGMNGKLSILVFRDLGVGLNLDKK